MIEKVQPKIADISFAVFQDHLNSTAADLKLADSEHPPHSYPAKFGYVLIYSPNPFGKKLFSIRHQIVNNKQTHFLKQNFSVNNNTNRQKVWDVDESLN